MNTLSLRALPLLLALPALALTGCDTEEDGTGNVLGGTYTGEPRSSNGSLGTFTLLIPGTESGSFTFTGTYTEPTGSTDNLSGTGIYVHPEITLNGIILEDGNDEDPFTITGDVSDSGDEIAAVARDTRDGDVPFTLSRD